MLHASLHNAGNALLHSIVAVCLLANTGESLLHNHIHFIQDLLDMPDLHQNKSKGQHKHHIQPCLAILLTFPLLPPTTSVTPKPT
jgi:hypothetical protein